MRIDELSFTHPLALYRGDGSGAALVRTAGALPNWARVDQPGAGINSDYLYLSMHSSEVEGYAADGSADAHPPVEPWADARLTPIGTWFTASDTATAEAADAALAARMEADAARIDSATFTVHGETPWGPAKIRIGPAVAGETMLECHAVSGYRLLTTIAPRHALERAQREPITVTVTYKTPRRLGTGMAQRTAQVTLSPAEPTSTAAQQSNNG